VHLVDLKIEIYYDARPYELQISPLCLQGVYKHKFTFDWRIITLPFTFCCCLFPHNIYSTPGGTCNCVLQLPYILAQFRLCLVIFTFTYRKWHDKYDLATRIIIIIIIIRFFFFFSSSLLLLLSFLLLFFFFSSPSFLLLLFFSFFSSSSFLLLFLLLPFSCSFFFF